MASHQHAQACLFLGGHLLHPLTHLGVGLLELIDSRITGIQQQVVRGAASVRGKVRGRDGARLQGLLNQRARAIEQPLLPGDLRLTASWPELAPSLPSRPVHFVRPERPVPMQLVAGQGHYETVIAAVMAARHSVWIATANLKELMVEDGRSRRGRRRPYRSVLEVFDELAGRGMELRILHSSMPSRAFREEFDRHPRLVSGGLELRACPRVHLKAVIVDAEIVYLGSANWTGAGLGAKNPDRRNFEIGIVTRDSQMLDDVQGMFDRIWRGGECGRCKLRNRCDAPLDL